MKKSFIVIAFVLACFVANAQITDTIVSKVPSYKHVIFEEYTGVNCQFCPEGHRLAALAMETNPGRVSVINIHTGTYASQFKTQYGAALAEQTGLTSYPVATVNRHLFPGNEKTALSSTEFLSKTDALLQQFSPVNIAARGTLDYTTRELNLTIQLYYTSSSISSTNMLNVAIVQDNVLGPQVGMYTNPNQVEGGQYRHQHVLRHLLNGQWGDTIYTTTEGTFVEKQYTYTIPTSFGIAEDVLEAELANLKFIAFVSEGEQEIYTGAEIDVEGVNFPVVSVLLDNMLERIVPSCDNMAGAYLKVRNTGRDTINTMSVRYKVQGGSYQLYEWHGVIPHDEMDTIWMPDFSVNVNTNQEISAAIVGVNGETVSTVEKKISVDKMLYTCAGNMLLDIKTDQFGQENSFVLFGPSGDVVLEGGPFESESSVSHTFEFTPEMVGCYRLEVYDDYCDGINHGYGNGYIKMYDANGNTVVNHDGKFNDVVRFYLNVSSLASIDEHVLPSGDVMVFPNPANNVLNINSEEPISRVDVFNMQGQMVKSESGNVRFINIKELSSGMYLLKVSMSSGVVTQKIVKQ